MKKYFALALVAVMMLSMFLFPVSATLVPVTSFTESEGWHQANDVTLNGDFDVSVVINRLDKDSGVFFWADAERKSYYKVMVRWIGADRVDFYACRNQDGNWQGFLISEEERAKGSTKDCYVSVDEGWNATDDQNVRLDLSVRGGMLTVTLTGTTTKMCGKQTYDLAKPAHLDGAYNASTGLLPTVGNVGLLANDNATPSYSDFYVVNYEKVESFTEIDSFDVADNVKLDGDFRMSAIINRVTHDSGVFFWADTDRTTFYSVKLRQIGSDRTDFYVCRNQNGDWLGFLISEEELAKGSTKDCYVSVDEGWNTTDDNSFRLDLAVTGNILTVTLTGSTTGKSGTQTYDLTKATWKDGAYGEKTGLLPAEGSVGFMDNASFGEMEINNFEPAVEENNPSTSDAIIGMVAVLAVMSASVVVLSKKSRR